MFIHTEALCFSTGTESIKMKQNVEELTWRHFSSLTVGTYVIDWHSETERWEKDGSLKLRIAAF